RSYGSSVRRTIRNQWQEFLGKVKIIVGSGRKTDFWKDHWIGLNGLKCTFLDLYLLSLQIHAKIDKIWNVEQQRKIFSEVRLLAYEPQKPSDCDLALETYFKACLAQENLQRSGFHICSRYLSCEQKSESNEHFSYTVRQL
ncbi:hypothetical protein H5410_022125, partial [Solanum commersonii]